MSDYERTYRISLREDELDTVIEALIERSASIGCPAAARQLHDLAHKFLPPVARVAASRTGTSGGRPG